MFTSSSVTIVTAATGHPGLARCIGSASTQSFPQVDHLVVIDGPEHEAAVRAVVAKSGNERTRAMLLPHATGKQNWNGHRIYGAASFLCQSEFIAFLDEDNWLDVDHIQNVMTAIGAEKTDWGFSLRKLWSQTGECLGFDKCESLGPLHHVWNDPKDFLVDTSAYVIRRELAVELAPLWYRPARKPGVFPADRSICRALMRHRPKVGASREHTLNYAVANRADSVQASYFTSGNRAMEDRYGETMPWERAS